MTQEKVEKQIRRWSQQTSVNDELGKKSLLAVSCITYVYIYLLHQSAIHSAATSLTPLDTKPFLLIKVMGFYISRLPSQTAV